MQVADDHVFDVIGLQADLGLATDLQRGLWEPAERPRGEDVKLSPFLGLRRRGDCDETRQTHRETECANQVFHRFLPVRGYVSAFLAIGWATNRTMTSV